LFTVFMNYSVITESSMWITDKLSDIGVLCRL